MIRSYREQRQTVEMVTMITDAITYLKESDEVWKTSLIGGLLLLFSFLLIPLFVVWGYVVRVLDRTTRGDDDAPVFEDWSELTVDGAKAFFILFVYSLIPILVGAVLFTIAALIAGGEIGSIAVAGMVLGGMLTFGLLVAAAYVVPAAIANFAEERRIGAGFAFETLRPVLSSGTYATGWLVAFGIALVGGVVGSVLTEIPLVGIVLSAIVSFYALVTAFYVIGQTWEEVHPNQVGDRGSNLTADRPAV